MLRDRMQNVLVMRPAVRRAFERAVRQDVEPALAGGAPGEHDALLTRLERFFSVRGGGELVLEPYALAWLREARAPR